MTDRAESVLAAFTTAVTGLTTTGARVVRGRVYPVDIVPALTVNMGAEQTVNDGNTTYQDEYLDIEVQVYVKDNTSVDGALNQIRAEVYKAVLADYKLGLAYVLDTQWMGRDAPSRSGEMENKSARQTLNFRVNYRHSYLDAEN